VETTTADRPDTAHTPGIVRDLTGEELAAWMPHVGTLARGVRAVWVDLLATPDWEPLPAGVRKLCRHPKCSVLGVVERRRVRRTTTGGVTPQWWAYCGDHAEGEYQPGVPGTSQPSLLTRRIVGASVPT
jgi:hypothetical protein